MSVQRHVVRKHFTTYAQLIAECGLEHRGSGVPLTMEAIFQDWAGVVRSTGKVPTALDYGRHGKYSHRPFAVRFKYWRKVPAGMLAYMVERSWTANGRMCRNHCRTPEDATGGSHKIQICFRMYFPANDYGRPADLRAATSARAIDFCADQRGRSAGRVCLPCARAGLTILRLQAAFPDCEALRQVGPNKGQRVLIELEYESRNFLEHRHPLKGCDLIVCWINNWPDCPLEVIELSSVLRDCQNRRN